MAKASEKMKTLLENALEKLNKDGFLYLDLNKNAFLFANNHYAEIGIKLNETTTMHEKIFYTDEVPAK